jgi:hypothetical protein
MASDSSSATAIGTKVGEIISTIRDSIYKAVDSRNDITWVEADAMQINRLRVYKRVMCLTVPIFSSSLIALANDTTARGEQSPDDKEYQQKKHRCASRSVTSVSWLAKKGSETRSWRVSNAFRPGTGRLPARELRWPCDAGRAATIYR